MNGLEWLALMGMLAAATALYAADDYPRSVPLPKGGVEPEYAAFKVKAADGKKLVVHEWKPAKCPETTPIVLLVHGIGMHGKPYAAISAGFASKAIILVAPDLRGHGESEGPRGEMPATKTMRDDLDAITDQIVARYPKAKIVLAGESMGGLIAADYARRAQKRFAGLALLAPAFSVHADTLKSPATLTDLFKTKKVPIHGQEFLKAATRDEGFAKACKNDPLGLYDVHPGYLLQLANLGLDWPMAGSELRLPLYVTVALEDKIVDNAAARRVWTRAKADKQDKVWKEWKEARHTLTWDPLSPQIVEHLADWIVERTKP